MEGIDDMGVELKEGLSLERIASVKPDQAAGSGAAAAAEPEPEDHRAPEWDPDAFYRSLRDGDFNKPMRPARAVKLPKARAVKVPKGVKALE